MLGAGEGRSLTVGPQKKSVTNVYKSWDLYNRNAMNKRGKWDIFRKNG